MKRVFYTLMASILLINCSNNTEVTKSTEIVIPEKKPDIKFGLTYIERFNIFKAISDSEAEADKKAMEMYPIDIRKPDYKKENIDKYTIEVRNLQDSAKVKIAKEFNIAEDTLWEIITEGVNRKWFVNY